MSWCKKNRENGEKQINEIETVKNNERNQKDELKNIKQLLSMQNELWLQLEVYPNFKSNYCTVKKKSTKQIIVTKPKSKKVKDSSEPTSN